MMKFYYTLKAEVITMARIISKCPGCAGMLHITTLRCPDCGMEIKQDYALPQFDKLTDEEFSRIASIINAEYEKL